MFTIRRSFGRWRIWLWSNRRESWRVTKVRENLSILVRNRWVFWRQTWDNNQPCLWGQEPDIIYVKTENLQVCLWQFKPKKKDIFWTLTNCFLYLSLIRELAQCCHEIKLKSWTKSGQFSTVHFPCAQIGVFFSPWCCTVTVCTITPYGSGAFEQIF